MSKCRKCNSDVTWSRNNGRWRCLNPDGSDHWDKCSELRTAVFINEGEAFASNEDQERVTGYIHDRLGVRVMSRGGKVIVGKEYKRNQKRNKVSHGPDCVPWEDCICSQNRENG